MGSIDHDMQGQGNLTCDVTRLSSSHWLDSITCSPRRSLIGRRILLLLTLGPVVWMAAALLPPRHPYALLSLVGKYSQMSRACLPPRLEDLSAFTPDKKVRFEGLQEEVSVK